MANFENWLDKFENDFKSFTDDEKTHVVETVLKLSGPFQLRFLQDELPSIVKRDFIQCLPMEVSLRILNFLDYKTISCCCLVSRDWNEIASKCKQVWIDACKELGVFADKKSLNETDWKVEMRHGVRRIKRFRNYTSFGFAKRELAGHTKRVTALYYKNGLLASGSDDRTVLLWKVASGDYIYKLTCHTCTDLKFDEEQVITASCDNTLARWEWSSGACLTRYQGHVGSVFCVDYSRELDLVLSGSSDCTVKIWQLSTGLCLATKMGHLHWLISVLLAPLEQEYQAKLKRKHVAISMCSDCIKVWSTYSSDDYCCLTTMLSSCVDSQTSVCKFKPKLLCDGRNIICASDGGVCVWNLETLQFTRNHILHIFKSQTQQCICEMSTPWSKPGGFRFNDCCGDLAWLGDCSPDFEKGPIYFGTSNEKIVVLQWSMNSDVVNGVHLTFEEMARNSIRT